MIHWSPDPDLIHFGALRVRWYGLMFLAGFLTGYQIIKWMCRREKKDFEKLEPLLYYVIAGTTIGARLGHCLFYEPGYYLSHPIEILKIWQGGLASHGGTLGVMIALWMYSRKHPEFSLGWLLDRMSMPAAITASFIRIGNLMNSEILGRPSEVPWAFVFERIDKVPRHPTQLYESITYFVLFWVLITIYRKSRVVPTGLLFGIMLIWIFLSRMVLEVFKENQVAFENAMTLNMGQLLSVPFVLLGVVLVIRALKALKNPPPAPLAEGVKASKQRKGKKK